MRKANVRIVISEFMDRAAVDFLSARHDVHYDPKLVERRDELAARAVDAHALIVRNRTQVDASLIGSARQLVAVGRLGVGLDNIDVAACSARGIEVIPATGANALAVAEYVIATSMLLLRRAYFATDAVAGGGWPREALSKGRELGGRTLGLVGFGSIGRATAGLARALGMRVIAFDAALPRDGDAWQATGVEPRPLDALLAQSDVVSLHVPLLPSTRNLIGAPQLAAMKAGAILVNSARGGVVDEDALASALRSGHLGGAALDVFANEPLPAGSALAGCPNLVLTPHIAGITAESNARVSRLIAQRVLDVLAAQR